MRKPLIGWHYSLRHQSNEQYPYRSWAEVVMLPNGYMSFVSDFANGAFVWSAHGHRAPQDFRHFWLGMAREVHYFCSKHGRQTHFNLDETVKSVKARIIDLRRHGRFTCVEAREEWERMLLLESGDLSRDAWCGESDISDAYEEFDMDYEPDLRSFAELFLPLLRDAIQQDLQSERPPETAATSFIQKGTS